MSVDYKARLQAAVYDYQILSLGPWDDESTAREAELRKQYRSVEGLAKTIANLSMDLAAGGEWLR